MASLQGVANAAWFLLDIAIVVTYFKFGKNDCATEAERRRQAPFGALALAVCVVIQLLFVYGFGDGQAEIYSAYLQNIAMSIAYLYFLRAVRRSTTD